MADTTTTTYSLTKPEVGASEDTWGTKINNNLDSIDDLLDGTTAVTGIDINSGTIDGVTIGATTAPTVTDLGSVATADINGGTIDGVVIGGTTTAAGSFTTITGSDDVTIDTDTFHVDVTNDRVGIGTASPATDLHIENSSGSPAVRMIGSTSGVCKIEFGDSGNSSIGKIEYNHTSNHLDFKVNDSVEFRMEGDGDFHADGDVIAYSTTTASDERLKENIELVTDAVEKCEALRGVTFDWKRDGSASAGVIAQEVQQVLPEAVKQVTGMNGEDHLTVNYGALTSILIEAVKELSARIEELEAK